MKIKAIRCKKCGDTIYSRARWDFHYCTCGEIFIDGGFDYLRCGFKTLPGDAISLDLNVTKQKLYKDWNERIDKFGLMKGS